MVVPVFIIVSVSVILLVAFLCRLVWASASISSGVYVKAVCKVLNAGKVAYLTFDDGPDPENTMKVLDVLDEYGAKAVFFLIGNKILDNQQIVAEILRRGHLVGNHSWSHDATFPLKGFRTMLDEVSRTQSAITNVRKSLCTGTVESVPAMPSCKLFRPPFGVTDPTIGKVVKALGLNTIGWSIRTFDTNGGSLSVIASKVRRKLHPGAIILMHDRLPQAPDNLRAVLEVLKAEGYAFDRTLPES